MPKPTQTLPGTRRTKVPDSRTRTARRLNSSLLCLPAVALLLMLTVPSQAKTLTVTDYFGPQPD